MYLASTSTSACAGYGAVHDEITTSEPPDFDPVRPDRKDVLPGPRFSRQQLEYLASGPVSTFFGPEFERQDRYPRHVRLPAPPLLLVDRVTGIDAAPGSMGTGTIWTETDIGDETWYVHAGRMPAGLMIESAQGTLLLLSWLGVDWHNRGERVFRLLGCEVTWHGPLPEPGERLVHEIHIDGHVQQGDVLLFSFRSVCRIGGELRMTIRNGQAGFFTDAELAASRGLAWDPATAHCRSERPVEPPALAHERRSFDADAVRAFADGDLRLCFGENFERSAPHGRTPTIQAGRMQLIERVDRYEPDGGPWGRGYLKASLPVSAQSWFFAAHFTNDPCMPGTLMFEGGLQAMAFYLAAHGFTVNRDGWRFEPVIGERVELVCRGQATPASRELVYEIFVQDLMLEEGIPVLYADILCSVDGLKAFHARRVGLKLVPGRPLEDRQPTHRANHVGIRIVDGPAGHERVEDDGVESVIDLITAPWLRDHRPNYAVPTLPLACSMDRMAEAALNCFPGRTVVGLRDVRAKRWIVVEDKPTRLKTRVNRLSDSTAEVILMVWRDAATPTLSRFEPAASAIVVLSDTYPEAPARLPAPPGLHDAENPYRAKRVFHGPAFQRIREFQLTDSGCRAIYDAVPAEIPVGVLAPALIDASLHGIPIAHLFEWCSDVRPGEVAYPSYFSQVDFFGPPPQSGDVTCTVVFAGRAADRELGFDIELLTGNRVWARLHAVWRTYQSGAIGAAEPAAREAFMERRHAPGVRLSRQHGDATHLSDADLQQLEWLPGTVRRVYAVTARGDAAAREVAVKEHLAQRLAVHPSEIVCDVHDDRGFGFLSSQPLIRFPVEVARVGMETVVVDAGKPLLDVAVARQRFEQRLKSGRFAISDMADTFLRRFVRDVTFEDPATIASVKGRGVLFLANHQTTVESFMLHLIGGALTGNPVMVLTRAEYRQHWMGALEQFMLSYPGVEHPPIILFFDRQDPASLPKILEGARQRLADGASLLVHVEGACALAARRPVDKLSSVFSDLAVAADLPIIPVRVTGALPVEPIAAESQFPVGFAAQDYHFGRAIEPGELRSLPYAERRRAILAAINRLGPPMEEETLNPSDPAFAAGVARLTSDWSIGLEPAVFIEAMLSAADPCAQTILLKKATQSARLIADDGERGQWLARFVRWLLPDISIELY